MSRRGRAIKPDRPEKKKKKTALSGRAAFEVCSFDPDGPPAQGLFSKMGQVPRTSSGLQQHSDLQSKLPTSSPEFCLAGTTTPSQGFHGSEQARGQRRLVLVAGLWLPRRAGKAGDFTFFLLPRGRYLAGRRANIFWRDDRRVRGRGRAQALVYRKECASNEFEKHSCRGDGSCRRRLLKQSKSHVACKGPAQLKPIHVPYGWTTEKSGPLTRVALHWPREINVAHRCRAIAPADKL